MPRELIPRPYMAPMIEHAMVHPRCALWAGMGMGKTVTCLTLIDYLKLTGEVSRVLVLGPKRVARSVWHEEAAKWNHTHHLRVAPAVGDAAHRLRQLASDADIYTLNYENLPWLAEQVEKGKLHWKWDMVIADEATALSSYRTGGAKSKKNGDPRKAPKAAARTTALAKFAFRGVTRWINLTGTPSLKRLQSLWGQTWFLDRGQRLGLTFGAFENRWFGYAHGGSGSGDRVTRVPFPHSQTEIQALLSDICLGMDPKDWFPIKEPNVIDVEVTLPKDAMAVYKAMERDLFAKLKTGEVEAFAAAGKSIKLLQLASGNVYLTPEVPDPNNAPWEAVHDEKLDALAEIIEETDVPVLVAFHFKPDKERILKRFKDARLIDTKRDEDDFKAGKIPIALVHPASIGHGVDGFQYVTNVMVFFGHWWSTEQRAQLIERIGPVRQLQAGLDRPVFIYNIVAKGTIDRTVLDAHENKISVQQALIDAAKRACT